MPSDPRPLQPLPTADGVDTLYSTAYAQTYHSKHGALAEARHVFLKGSGVAARLAEGLPTRVLEVGFGTGLNFLVTAHHATQTGAPLYYTALEHDLLPAAVLARLNHGTRLGAPALHEALLAWRSALPHRVAPGIYPHAFSETLTLTLIAGDATIAPLSASEAEAVYLDAFSPDANPELWTPAFLAQLFGTLRPGGRLATYSAKGSVRRTLEAVGFRVARRPGPPGKREMLVAER